MAKLRDLLPLVVLGLGCAAPQPAPEPLASAAAPALPVLAPGPELNRALYAKREVMIPMRDGAELFTAIYTPRDAAAPFPILLRRTPYSCRPYGPDAFPPMLGPGELFTGAGYGFAIQDVRGAYMSQGEFVDMRPHKPVKRGPGDVDESTDAWDTIDWLVKNVAGNNGRVGMWGISYPGFYAAAGMIDAHPALKAVSPQAPIADWWWDDFHHNGALFLPHAFLFLSGFGRPRPEPVETRRWNFDMGTPDGWEFFLAGGSPGALGQRHFGADVAFWDQMIAHPNYDAFWQERNLLPHLERVAPAVMTVGGWFDAEDLYGPLAIYAETERRNPGVFNVLVMGPWSHGGWGRTGGDALGQARFGSRTSEHYRARAEKPFFDQYLLDRGRHDLPEAWVFDTGANEWREFPSWPPAGLRPSKLSLLEQQGLVLSQQVLLTKARAIASFVSDPTKPVPHTQSIERGMNKEYMTEDQRFAARRPDVVTFTSEPLEAPVTLAGPLKVRLRVATDGTDADWIVKLVDVFPGDARDPADPPLAPGQKMGGYQMLVRGDVMPARFREGFETPVATRPGQPENVDFTLWDVLHTFQKGHRIQIQVQSTWFPLVARNPQTFLANPYLAGPEDYRVSLHEVLVGSHVEVGVLENP